MSTPPTPSPFGDYLVFVDESGDQSLAHINPQYPVFVLAFAVVRKSDYSRHITPDLQTFKFGYWGHDEVVLHEHDIRKPSGAFAFLHERSVRERFLSELSGLMQALPTTIVAVVIDKVAFASGNSAADSGLAYDHAMQTGLDAVYRHLTALGQSGHTTPIIVECRGRKEDAALELAFRRFRTTNRHGCVLPFDLVMIPKTSNSAGLQLADLIARPIGLHHLRPGQPNRAFDLIHSKLIRTPDGQVEGHGLILVP